MPNYRRIIDAYRSKLMEVSPAACNEVDDQMWDEGEKWVSNAHPPHPGTLCTAMEFQEHFGIPYYRVRDWAKHHPDKIPTQKRGKSTVYLVRDVMAFHAEKNSS